VNHELLLGQWDAKLNQIMYVFNQETTMTVQEDFARQAQDMFAAAKDAKIPENLQHMAEETVTKTREAFHKMNSAAKDSAKTVEDLVLASTAGNKAISEKMFQNTVTNTESLFDAAQAMARAKTLPEAAQIQAKFFQQQMTTAGAQTKELFELSTKVAKQTFETMNQAATKSFEQIKKAS
jgi:phasin